MRKFNQLSLYMLGCIGLVSMVGCSEQENPKKNKCFPRHSKTKECNQKKSKWSTDD